MVPARSVGQGSSGTALDGWFFALSSVAGLWFSYVLLRDSLRVGWSASLLVVFWLFFSYLVLPRLHRILTAIYLPGYFVGRTRTSDGLLGDPVNIGLRGREAQVHAAMGAAGWTLADPVDVRSAAGIVSSVLRRRSYPAAPVSPLHLFDRQQDFAYEREVRGTPSHRHHVRFWRCPDGWLLPGGFRVDWVAAASFDRRVGLSWFTLQVTHRIAEDVDRERDFVLSSVRAAVPGTSVVTLEHFSSGYHHHNGGGDRIRTDGDLPILDLRGVEAGADLVLPREDAPRWPPAVLVGAGVALARGSGYVVAAAAIGFGGPDSQILALFLVAAVVDLVLATGILRGRNWARLLLMTACSVTALTAMIHSFVDDRRPVELHDLLTSGASILVILALSSPSAREYATTDRSPGRTEVASR
jgi:hypothetical protein